MVNSCLGLFTAAGRGRLPLSRSYGVNLPSSLTTLLPLALGFSPHLPVSVCGTGLYTQLFSPLSISDFSTDVRSLSPRSTNAGVQISQCVPVLKIFGGHGFSTVCASTTPRGLALAPGLPWADEPSPRNLRFSAIMIRYSFRHSHSNTVHTCSRSYFTLYSTLPYQV